MTEIDIGGLFVPPLLICALLALPLTSVCSNLLQRLGFYRLVWHRHLFNTALYTLLVALCWWLPSWLATLTH